MKDAALACAPKNCLPEKDKQRRFPPKPEVIWGMSVEFAFQAMDGTPEIRDALEKQFANLEQRCGPVRACRVVIKGTDADDHADRYGVIIYLALAEGLEVKIGPPRRQDTRYADLTFAITDTFRRARRRLQDRRRIHRRSKEPEHQPSGHIAKLEPGEFASTGTHRGVLPSAVAGTAAMQHTSLRCREPKTDIGSSSVVPDAEPPHGRPDTNKAPEQADGFSAHTENIDPTLAKGVQGEPMQAVQPTPSFPPLTLPNIRDPSGERHRLSR